MTATVLFLTALEGSFAGGALAADQGARHHAQGQFDNLTATYVVAEGDELLAIAERFAIPLDDLKAQNRLASDRIRVGQRLIVGAMLPAAEPVLEPKALEVLKAMGERLKGAKALAFTALTTYEQPSRLGPPLAYTSLSEVLLERPDRLRVISAGDGPVSELYFDGRILTAYSPAEDLAAVVEVPGTLDTMLEAAFHNAAIYLPFTDLIVADPDKDMAEGLIHAFYIGKSKVVGGTLTDMVALANPEVFVQMWIGADDHLPRQVRAVYRSDPLWLRNVTELSNWQIDPPVAPDAFASTKAGAARRIPFGHPASPLPGPRPAAAPGGSHQPQATQSQ